MAVRHLDVLNKLCDALGLPKTVRSLTLHADVKSIPTISVEYFPDEPESDKVVEVLTKQFEIAERSNQ